MNRRVQAMGFLIITGYLAVNILFHTAFLNMPIFPEPAIKAFVEAEPEELLKNGYMEQEDSLFKFIEKHMSDGNGGILTNLTAKKGKKEVLSESVGLMMNYAVIKGNRELFEKELKYLKENLLSGNSLVKWRVVDENTHCNAAIDDLRIIRSLLDAYNIWGSDEYLNTAGFIQQGLYDCQVDSGEFYEFFDWKTGKSKKRIPLCYLDLYTLDRISMFNEGWGEVANNGIFLIKNGRSNDKSPFYTKYYDYEKCRYFPDEEYAKGKKICLTYSILTALHLAEVNEDTGFFTAWLKEECEKGRLYAWYNPVTLKPANNMESTAVYALSSIYADRVGEKTLARELLDNMQKFRISDEKSPYYGGYGDEQSKDFYSFDNLTALLALAEATRQQVN